ncbi:MAG: ComEC/Rec2 family competence protein [Deltaproteobacteria bacterium]|nr:ComEC/Rec2 family competence protein [Deltaproteobacteria bacterium]
MKLFLSLWLLAGQLAAQHLEIRFLNVGQGDAALIRESGKTALIDAGGSGTVVSYLKAFRLDTLDVVVASHNHADHIGGMSTVLSSAVVRFYMDNGVPHTTATYARTIQAVRASGAQYLSATSRTITLGAAKLQVLEPPPAHRVPRTHNNSSVGILLEYGQFRALFTGDSERAELGYWLSTGTIGRVHVLKVAHHGSWNGTSRDWVDATRPQAAVISVGRNSYGHPSPQVVAQWQAAGARVYRTDLDGSILILANTDGSFVVTTDQSDPSGVVQLRPFVQDTSPRAGAAAAQPARACCRICTRGKACGNSCINRAYQCRRPPGCACDAQP